jgi:hypothetical protein
VSGPNVVIVSVGKVHHITLAFTDGAVVPPRRDHHDRFDRPAPQNDEAATH